MKKLLFILLLVPSLSRAACPLYTYPENHKLDQEINNICNNELNPLFSNATGSTVTVTYVNASSATFRQINATTGTINSFMVVGTATNDSAPTGRLGESVVSSVSSFVNSPASGVWGDITSIPLTAGDWDVSVQLEHYVNTATWTDCAIGMSDTAGNSTTNLTRGYTFDNTSFASSATAVVQVVQTIATVRWSLAVASTLYLKIKDVFSGGQPQALGKISARRVR